MSLRVTEVTYNHVIEHVIKEITEDPQMNHISNEALDYLKKTWTQKLQESGVYTPPNDFPRVYGQNTLPIRPLPGTGDNYGQVVPHMTPDIQAQMARFMQARSQFPYQTAEYMHDSPVWMPPQGYPMYPQQYNIQYNAKAQLPQAAQPTLAPAMLQQPPNMAQNLLNKNDQDKKDMGKLAISIKTEPNVEESNNSRVPVKTAHNGNPQTPGENSTQKSTQDGDAATQAALDKEKAKPTEDQEEEKEEEKENAPAAEEEEDDDDIFEYKVTNSKNDTIALKEEHIPPPIQQGNAAAIGANLDVKDLNPYDPEDRPLDSDDDPDYGETPDATDQLLAFHDKVHRHGSKWKVNLRQGILTSKGKEYILTQLTGDFDFI